MKYNLLKDTAFQELVKGTGILLKAFDPTGATEPLKTDILCTTKDGIKAELKTTFIDAGANIDNAPKNTMELKMIDERTATLSTTVVGITKELLKTMIAGATVSTDKVMANAELKAEDFQDIWFVADVATGGTLAIKLSNALSTGGFSISTKDKENGEFTLELTGHYSIVNPEICPMEFYVLEV